MEVTVFSTILVGVGGGVDGGMEEGKNGGRRKDEKGDMMMIMIVRRKDKNMIKVM